MFGAADDSDADKDYNADDNDDDDDDDDSSDSLGSEDEFAEENGNIILQVEDFLTNTIPPSKQTSKKRVRRPHE